LIQGYIAKLSLFEQLKSLKIIKDEKELDNPNNKEFMQFFRHVWADNGDAISTFYAGTPAIRVSQRFFHLLFSKELLLRKQNTFFFFFGCKNRAMW
jgi:hypothetical protein